ncbi:hypothetical protein NIES2101_26390 [Calothrix sp. HK-06]|nr:hypothetical protein NIES2101_26390 [Calothrix sp. HK-06]
MLIYAKIKCNKQSQQNGFTIIESLMAIVIVSILLVAIAPVLALSVANRVNTRRIELASQAARAYIDGVRGQVITAPAALPVGTTALKDFPAPTASGTFSCSANSYCTNTATSTAATNLYCIDSDGDGNCTHSSIRDLVIQAFRFNPSSDVSTKGYSIGVRVYRADAFARSSTFERSTGGARQSSFSGNLGRRTVPLVELTTEINEVEPKWSDICDRTNSGVATNSQGCS